MKKKIKLINPKMKFNLLLNKFEPELPLRKNNKIIKRKRNWWAYWCVIIEIIILVCIIVWQLIKNFF